MKRWPSWIIWDPSNSFFTLSCADRRWDENFSVVLRKLGVSIEYTFNSDGTEETFVILVQEKEKKFDGRNKTNKDIQEKKKMEDYIKEDLDSSLHELLRTHTVNATRNYHQRVKAFIKNIVTDKNNPMCVEYWTTKVEFQGRGAAHNHGTIWVNMKQMEFKFIDNKGNWTDLSAFFNPKN